MNLIYTHKTGYLHTASWSVIGYMCRTGVLMVPCAGPGHRAVGAYIWAFLAWIKIWLGWMCQGPRPVYKVEVQAPALINRRHKRKRRALLRRKQSPVCAHGVLFHLCGRFISRRQFMELMCTLSYNRVVIYGLRFWGKVLKWRTLLRPFIYGGWQEPLGAMGRVNIGVWRVHLWPT